MIDDPDLRQHFAAESEEHLDAIEGLLGTPGAGAERSAVDTLFRAFHSLKGMSGALGAGGMLAVAHRCEDILGLARQGRVAVPGAVADALVAAVDLLRQQRSALLDEGLDLAAPEGLLSRLATLADNAPAPAPAPTPAPPAAPAEAIGQHHPVLAGVTREVAASLAGRLDPQDVEAQQLSAELVDLAKAAGARRLALLFGTLAGSAGESALPMLGEVCRQLDALAGITGDDAGAAALRLAVAARAGDGGLPRRLFDLAASVDVATAGDSTAVAHTAREAALIADALGFTALGSLLLSIEDLWDRTGEPDAAVAISEGARVFAARLRAAAAGGVTTLAEPPALETEHAASTAPEGVPEDFAAALGPEGRARLADALAGGLVLYRGRIGTLSTAEQEAELFAWLAGQGAIALTSRTLPGSDPPSVEFLVAGPADARALEASRARFDPRGDVIAGLTRIGAAQTEPEAGRAGTVTLRVRQEGIDTIIALQAELRAAALALTEAAEQESGRGLATALATLTEKLPSTEARALAALTERVRRLLANLNETGTRLSLSLRRLDDAMLELRVTPLSGVLGRMPRVARAAAQPLGKEIEVELVGGEVSIDRSLIELLADPLQHLVRNAVDHGVEAAETRASLGKPVRAIIRIAAERHGADRVRITVSDDGAGIDRDAVVRAAITRGIVHETEAAALDESAVHALLFRPGFSTREQVSETSGRGVGLDVVEDALHRAGGSLSIASSPGKGTTFTLDLPLSAAMAPVLMVEAGGHVYALPVARVESVLHAGNQAETSRLPAIVSLEATLGLPAPTEAPSIVVLRGSGGRLLGLSVGRVTRRADLLLRPLHPALATLPCVGGVGVLGTGEPVVVLEPDGFLPD